MAFGHPTQHGHMMTGVAKAAKSSKTPAHLRSHLENRMKTVGNQPITGAKTQMKPSRAKDNLGVNSQIQASIKQAPAPFKNKLAYLAPTGMDGHTNASHTNKGVADGKQKNNANIVGAKQSAGVPSSAANPFPKKRFAPSGKPSFYGA